MSRVQKHSQTVDALLSPLRCIRPCGVIEGPVPTFSCSTLVTPVLPVLSEKVHTGPLDCIGGTKGMDVHWLSR